MLVGPEAKIRAAAEYCKLDISQFEMEFTEHSHQAAERAVAMAREHKVEALMKGSLHARELMQFVDTPHGLRTARRMSHVAAVEIPSFPRPLFMTDTVVNVSPTVEEKRDIVQNAIDLAHTLAIAEPKVALLSAHETVSPELPSSFDAAVLCKMADRGQITGGVLDGPLGFDVAVSEAAAQNERHRLAGCRERRHPRGSGPGSRRDPDEATRVHVRRAGLRHGDRRPSAGGRHQPHRQHSGASWLVRAGPARGAPRASENVVATGFGVVKGSAASSRLNRVHWPFH